MASEVIVKMQGREEGAGLYGVHALGPAVAIKAHMPLVLQRIGTVPYDGCGPFTICDYGAADGGTSTRLVLELIKKIRQLHGDRTEIVVIYEDQANNDFTSLFKRIHGLLSVEERLPTENVFSFATGTSFYRQCCPSSSVHFGHTNFAAMNLSRRPCPIRDVIAINLSQNPEEIRRFAEHAARDWSTFLEMRAKELVPGGFLLVSILATDNEGNVGYAAGHVPTMKHDVGAILTDIWRGMRDEGMINEEEFQAMLIPTYFRRENELRLPLEDASSIPYRLGLRLESCVIRHRDEYRFDQWTQEHGLDEKALETAKSYARSFITSTRLWIEYGFQSTLNDSRNESEKAVIVDTLFQRYEDMITHDPTNYMKINVVATLGISKMT